MKILAPAALSLLVLEALSCSGPARKDEPAMSDGKQASLDAKQPTADEAVIARMRSAVASHVAPSELEAYMGLKAMVNTRTGFPLEGLRRVNLVPDPEHADALLALDSAEVVVYFERPVPSNDPKVIGIQYHRDGSAALFFAILLPP
jgi:hypothetical protein